MSNRGTTTVYDATGASQTAILNPGEMVHDQTTNGLRVGDGKTPGGIAQVAQYPAQPFLDLRVAADRVFDNLNQNFCYRADNDTFTLDELWPGFTTGIYTHQADTSVPLSNHNPWTLGVIHVPVYERWRTLNDAILAGQVAAADLTLVTAQRDHAASIIAHTWARMKAQYSVAQLKTMPYPFIYKQDDGNHYHSYLMEVISVTGDATAKAVLQEAIPQLTAQFLDPLQTGADLHSYAAITPDGTDFKWNQWGLVYTIPSRPDLIAGDGYRSHLGEAKTAKVAAWLARQTWVSAAYRAALLDYATNRSAFYDAQMLTPAPTGPRRAAANLGYCDFNLDPNVNANNNPAVNGGLPQGSSAGAKYDTGQTFHQPVDAWYDAATPTYSQTHLDYHCEAACLNWQLVKTVGSAGAATYQARFDKLIAAIPQDNGFCTTVYYGVRVLTPKRDAWIENNRIGETMRAVRQSRAAGGTTDPDGSFRQTVANSARNVIQLATHDGYYDQDYGGRVRSTYQGGAQYTWKQRNSEGNGYGGAVGAGFGHPRQLTTNGCSTTLVMAASQLAFDMDPAMLRSGISGAMSIETLASHVASLAVAIEGKAPLAGRHIFADPFCVVRDNTGIHHDGTSIYLMGDTSLTRGGFNRSTVQWEFTINGSGLVAVLGGGSYGIQAAAFRLSSTTALYSSGDGFGLSAASTQVLTATSAGVTIFTETTVYGAISPVNDAIIDLGKVYARFDNVRASNPAIQTSDGDQKKQRGPMTDAERAALREIGSSLVVFQWLAAIAKKGEGGARWHFGPIAQVIAGIMQAHGLIGTTLTDCPYAFLCWDSWEAVPAIPAVAAVPAQPALAPLRAAPADFFTSGEPQGPIRPAIPAVPAVPGAPAIPAGSAWGVRGVELLYWLYAVQRYDADALAARVTATEQDIVALKAKLAA